jgi:precorrin-6B methylase 1
MDTDRAYGVDDAAVEDTSLPLRRRGSLIVVGTGIEAIGQVTLAAEGAIRAADIVLYVVSDVLTSDWIVSLNPAAESMFSLYAAGRDRVTTYQLMVERIMSEVRGGRCVCAAFYGHPGMAATASHRAIAQARAEGYSARMQPGVSALDCLVCDLGIDLGSTGFQSYEATRFLAYRRHVNPFCPLILWQIGGVGIVTYEPNTYGRKGYDALTDALSEIYGPEHEVTLYEAAAWTVCDPRVDTATVKELATIRPTFGSTLYVPGKDAALLDAEMIDRLGMRDLITMPAGERE